MLCPMFQQKSSSRHINQNDEYDGESSTKSSNDGEDTPNKELKLRREKVKEKISNFREKRKENQIKIEI